MSPPASTTPEPPVALPTSGDEAGASRSRRPRRALPTTAPARLTRRERSVAQLRRLALRFPRYMLRLGEHCLCFDALSDAYIDHLRQVLVSRLRVHRRAVAGELPADLILPMHVDAEMSAREMRRQAEASERFARGVAELVRCSGTDKAEARAMLRGDLETHDILVATRAQRHAATLIETGLRDPAWRPTRADATVVLDGLVEALVTLARHTLDERERAAEAQRTMSDLVDAGRLLEAGWVGGLSVCWCPADASPQLAALLRDVFLAGADHLRHTLALHDGSDRDLAAREVRRVKVEAELDGFEESLRPRRAA